MATEKPKDITADKTPGLPEEYIAGLSRHWNDTMRATVEAVYAHLGTESPERIDALSASQLEAATMKRLQEKARDSKFVVLSSIAGGGKSTVGRLLEDMGFERLPRATTRIPRPGEVQGRDYEFMTRAEFDNAKAAGEFAYLKDTYGEGRAIRKSVLDAVSTSGKRFYAEGDALAYNEIRQTIPGYENLSYLSIFLIPESFDVALQRLQGRVENDIAHGANAAQARGEVRTRLENALSYVGRSGEHMKNGIYDGYLVNDNLERVRTKLADLFTV